ncbi:MAG: helix-turn-helix domain-containing protein [archaeon]
MYGMWYLKFRVKHKDCIYTPKTEELNIRDFTYPLGHVLNGNSVLLSAIHILEGSEGSIKKYVNYLKKHKDVLKIEGFGNVFFIRVREKLSTLEYQAVYNPELLFPAPMINDKDGFEIWQVASWDRKHLERIVKLSDSPVILDFKLLEFKKKIIHDVYISSLLPKLAPKQMEALRLAFENGYYEFPKKTDLNKLARLMRVHKTTYQEHLKRAESKIIPFILGQRFT